MNTVESIVAVMNDVGPKGDDIIQVLLTPDATWKVVYDDIAVEVELEDETGTLFIQAPVAFVPEANRLAAYTALLKYNFLRPMTGGVTAALSDDDQLFLMVQLSQDMTSDLMIAILDNFTTKARIWRDYVLSKMDEPQPLEQSFHPGIRA
ncbi:MAG: type III secretion system chaperone [Allorhizobium sp.]